MYCRESKIGNLRFTIYGFYDRRIFHLWLDISKTYLYVMTDEGQSKGSTKWNTLKYIDNYT